MPLEDFMANLETDGRVGEKAFEPDSTNTEEQEKNTPAVPPADTQIKTDKPSQGGDNTPDANLPFHKHPRWIKTQEELTRLREFEASTKPKLETYEQVIARIGHPEAQSQIPEWFPKSGDQKVDDQKYKEYLSYENGVKAQIKQELLEDQTKEAQAKADEEKKWTTWVNDSLDKLEDSGKTFDRNELQAVALKYLPSDEKGNIDFDKAFEIMTELNKVKAASQAPRADARKKVGDLTNTSRSTSESAKPQFETQRSLRNKSFDQLIRETN